MTLEGVVGTILVRDHYRWVRAQYLARFAVAVILIIALSLLGTLWLANKPEQYRYLLADAEGRLVQMVPLNQQNMSDDSLLKWTVDAVTKIYTFDFMNYRAQMQRSRQMLTVHGWKEFEKSMIESGNFKSVLANRFATTATPNGPAVIESRELMSIATGETRMLWYIRFPMTITYRSKDKTATQNLNMRIAVTRVPEFVEKSGVQIRQIIGTK